MSAILVVPLPVASIAEYGVSVKILPFGSVALIFWTVTVISPSAVVFNCLTYLLATGVLEPASPQQRWSHLFEQLKAYL